MSTQFAFQADSVTVALPAGDNFFGSNSSFTLTTPEAADPVSDATNNVRFACNGSAGHGGFETVMFTLKTRHTFLFRPRAEGRLTAHAHFMPQGGFSLAARKPTWLFDGPGSVSLNISMQMRVRVLAANRVEVLRFLSPVGAILSRSARARSYSASSAGTLDAEVLEFIRSQSFATIVGATDTVEVQARYTVQVIANDGATLSLDFASVPAAGGDPGDGMNAPFAVINISEL